MITVEKPFISVLIPSYNHQDYVGETLESIWSQNYSNLEIIVVDDCSSDNSRQRLQHLQQRSPVPVKLHFNEVNQGVAATLNRALSFAQGDLVAIIASDDLLAPDCLSEAVRRFEENPLLKVVYGNGRVLEGRVLGRRVHKQKVADLLAQEPKKIAEYLLTHVSPLFIQSALFKRELLLEIGGMDGQLLADDWQLNARVFQALNSRNEFGYIDNDQFYYRLHDTNVHRNYQRQRDLKLEFVEHVTPPALRATARSNIHYAIARQALDAGLIGEAWKHLRISRGIRMWEKPSFLWKLLRKSIANTWNRK